MTTYKKTEYVGWFCMLSQSNHKSNPEQKYYIQLSDKQALQFQKYIYYTI